MKYIHTIGLFFFTNDGDDDGMINIEVVVLSEIFISYFSLCSWLRIWLNSNRKRGRLVCVCMWWDDSFSLLLLRVRKMRRVREENVFAFFFSFVASFFYSLINGRGGMHRRNFLFFCIGIQSERKKREERGREKRFFPFFFSSSIHPIKNEIKSSI